MLIENYTITLLFSGNRIPMLAALNSFFKFERKRKSFNKRRLT
jgi:hypothetical protein